MKTTNRALHLALASLVMAVASTAMAQTPTLTGNYSSGVITSAARPEIQKELGVSDQVGQELKQLSDEYQATLQVQYQDAGIDPKDFPGKMTAAQRMTFGEIQRRVRDEYLKKTAALLSEDQINRVQQIIFQRVLKGDGVRALLNEPLLNLSTRQKNILASINNDYIKKSFENTGKAGFAARQKLNVDYLDKAIEVLTDEQKDILEKLKGKEYVQPDPPMPKGK